MLDAGFFDHDADAVEHRDDAAGERAVVEARGAVANRRAGTAYNFSSTVGSGQCDFVGDEDDAIFAARAEGETEHRRMHMDAVGNDCGNCG